MLPMLTVQCNDFTGIWLKRTTACHLLRPYVSVVQLPRVMIFSNILIVNRDLPSFHSASLHSEFERCLIYFKCRVRLHLHRLIGGRTVCRWACHFGGYFGFHSPWRKSGYGFSTSMLIHDQSMGHWFSMMRTSDSNKQGSGFLCWALSAR